MEREHLPYLDGPAIFLQFGVEFYKQIFNLLFVFSPHSNDLYYHPSHMMLVSLKGNTCYYLKIRFSIRFILVSLIYNSVYMYADTNT